MPKVSVVIPTYNRANFIGEAIQSVLAQTFTDFEIILVDDGSTDNTKDIVNSFKDPRIRYIYQENSGVSIARNKGISSSSAEYIAFLDSDDMYLEQMLEKSVQVLDTHPQVGFSYVQIQIMREGFGVYRVRKSKYHNNSQVVGSIEQVRELLLACTMITSSFVVRRVCFETSGMFHPELSLCEDWNLFVRLAKKYPAFYIAEPLIKYRYHDDQALHNDVLSTQAFPLTLKEVFEDPDIAPFFEDIKGKVYNLYYRTWMVRSVWGSDMKSARQYLIKAVNYYPRVILTPEIFVIMYKFLATLLPTRLRLMLRGIKRRVYRPPKARE